MVDYNYNVIGSYNFNKDTFLASIDREGNIIHEGANGRKKVGVDTQTAKEMQDVIDNYYNKLVDLGVLVKEKTPEEIAQEQAKEQAEINKALLAEIKNLNQRVEVLANGNDRHDNQASKSIDWEEPSTDTTSIRTSKKNDTTKSK